MKTLSQHINEKISLNEAKDKLTKKYKKITMQLDKIGAQMEKDFLEVENYEINRQFSKTHQTLFLVVSDLRKLSKQLDNANL